MKSSSGFRAGDLWGGLASASLVLPQAMAFGVALLLPVGVAAGTAALTGLVAACMLNLAAGAVCGTRGLISAPTGPVLVLLGGTLVGLQRAGLAGEQLLSALTVVVALTGLMQLMIGLSGAGQLIKYIPYPVVAGFMTGSAILMIASQSRAVGKSIALADPRSLLPAGLAGVTVLLIWGVPKLLRWIPGALAGLLLGTAVYQALIWQGLPAESSWVVGRLPGPESLRMGVSMAVLHALPWTPVVTAAGALAILVSLDTLLTSVVADVSTGERHRAGRELFGQGTGQLLSALLGGIAGAGTTGASLVAVRSGGRRWSAVVAAVSLAALMLVPNVGKLLPICVLAGIIIHVALGMVERDIVAWARRPRTRLDAGIALLVTLVTVTYDLMVAVGLGMAIALALFIRAQVQAPVIHRRFSGKERHSTRRRTEGERALLEAHGDRITLVELRGNLFFGTTDRLYSELHDVLDRPGWVILHMRRVGQADLTSLKLLQQMAQRLSDNGGQLLFCNVHREIGIGHDAQETLSKISPTTRSDVRTFIGSDEALEYAENELLMELDATIEITLGVELAECQLCESMPEEAMIQLEQICERRHVPTGSRVFGAGDHGEELIIVLAGEVDVLLPTTRHHHKRLAKYGPGTWFGEISFLRPGPRAAAAVAVRECELLILKRAAFDQFAREHPEAGLALLTALARSQGKALRWSAREISRLSEW